MASKQTLCLGMWQSQWDSCLKRLTFQKLSERLWAQDPSLWTQQPTVEASIRNRLGWLSITPLMLGSCSSLENLARELRQDGFTDALLLGMGGSGLFSEVCRSLFGVAPGALELIVLDTTDPTAILTQQRRLSPERFCAIVSSKSGTTIEITALSRYWYERLSSLAKRPGAPFLAITDARTPLESQAKAWNFRRIFVHGKGAGAEVGGRFSALTYFGLVPAALIGVNTQRLLERAQEMFARCGVSVRLEDNPGVQLGAAIGSLGLAGKDKLTLLCSDATAGFSTWVEQLIAESLGKQGKGIIPIHGEKINPHAFYGEDRLFIELQLASAPDRALEEHVAALIRQNHPVIRIRWEDLYDLGGEVAKWELATAVAGAVMEVNPFDEPNVQESKDRTKVLLEQHARSRTWNDEAKEICEEKDIVVYAASLDLAAESLAQCLGRFFATRQAGDYIAFLSFLPRLRELDEILYTLREQARVDFGLATLLGFGPRYLHSTGQLFKGGSNSGLFVLLTSEEPEDLPIPGEPFTFGILKQAQALGDFQAMRERKRRVLRVHCKGTLLSALKQLKSALEQAGAPAQSS